MPNDYTSKFAIQRPSKMHQNWAFGLKINHLATLGLGKMQYPRFEEVEGITSIDQDCQILLGKTKTGKNIPNIHKIYLMALKYTKYP
jgi:hypothetical protein